MLELSEFIGMKARVVSAFSRAHVGISGTIVDETRETFTIEKEDGKRAVVPKKGSIFSLEVEGKESIINGTFIKYKPTDRIKKLKRRFRV
ncbi:MAG: ribonuclease P protein subunit [Candidatus Anstonellales archaeon]